MTDRAGAGGRLERALTLQQAGRLDEAADLCAEVLAAEPRHIAALHLLGILEDERGRYAEAERWLAAALNAEPRSVIAALRRGGALLRLRRLEEAARSFEQVLAISRDIAEGWHGLGLALLDLRGPQAALPCYARALTLGPAEPGLLVNYANALRRLGRIDESLVWFARGLAVRPDYAEAHYNHALALQNRRRIDDAVPAYRRALALRPDLVEAWRNVAGLLLGMGGCDDAIAAYGHAGDLSATGEVDRARLSTLLYREPAGPRFYRLAVAAAKRAAPDEALPAPGNDRDPDRRLRVGFLSSDFHFHPAGRTFRSVFAHRDRPAFEYLCYGHERRRDALSDWYRAQADGWRLVQDLSDREIAALIRQDRVDVLVLIAGYFDHNRPAVAAWRAAPVQVSVGDAATSGISEMDYFIGDPILTPAGGKEPFVETPVQLPIYYNNPPRSALPIRPRQPAVDGAVVFGSFNNPSKLTRPILEVWGRILARLPRAKLLFKYKDAYARSWLRRKILTEVAAGAEADVASRIDFMAADEAEEGHLARHGEVDIALDSYPFSGATTSFDAFWMGVPVVTLLGDTVLSRMTASQLFPLGLGDLVARTHEEYVGIAVSLALDRQRLAALRSSLRDRLLASPLMDEAAYARTFEDLVRDLWRRWAEGRGR